MYKWITVLLLGLAHCIWGLIGSCVGAISPFLIEELNFTSTQVGLLVSALSLGYSIMMVPAGIWSDLIGVRIPLTSGIVFLGIIIYTVTKSTSFISGFILFVLLGLAGGLTMPSATKSIMYWFTVKGRATAMGIKQSGINLGGMLAGILLPVLAVRSGWEFSLEFTAFISLLSAIVIFVLYKESPHHNYVKVDSNSIRVQDAISLMWNKRIVLLGIVALFFLLVQFAFSTYLVLFLTKELKIDVVLAGRYLFASFSSGILGRIGLGIISDYFLKSKRILILMIMAILIAILCIILGMVSENHAHWIVFIIVFIFGFTGMGWNALFLTITGECVGKELSATAIGLATMIGFIGVMFGPPIFGHILDKGGSFFLAWNFLTICMLFVLFMLIFFRRELNIP